MSLLSLKNHMNKVAAVSHRGIGWNEYVRRIDAIPSGPSPHVELIPNKPLSNGAKEHYNRLIKDPDAYFAEEKAKNEAAKKKGGYRKTRSSRRRVTKTRRASRR